MSTSSSSSSSLDHQVLIAILRKTLRRYLTDHHSFLTPTTAPPAKPTNGSGSSSEVVVKPMGEFVSGGLSIPWSTVLPFGSRALNAELPGGDLDCVMFVQAGVGFNMFASFADLYLAQAGFKVKAKVVNARVPLIKTVYEGIETDILTVELATPSIPTRERLLSSVEIFDKCTVASRPSINGRRTVMLIQNLVPFPETIFGRVLKAVKMWLKAREIYGTVFTYPGGVGVAVLVAKACIDHFQCLVEEFVLGKVGSSGGGNLLVVESKSTENPVGGGGGGGGSKKDKELLDQLEDFQEAALVNARKYQSPHVGEGSSSFSEDGTQLVRPGCRNLKDVYTVLIQASRSTTGEARRIRRQKPAALVPAHGRRAFEQVLGIKAKEQLKDCSSSSPVENFDAHPVALSEEVLVDGIVTHVFRFFEKYFKRLKSNQGGSIQPQKQFTSGKRKNNNSSHGNVSPQPSGSMFGDEIGSSLLEPIYITEDYQPQMDNFTGAAIRIQNMPECWGQSRSNYYEELVVLNPAYPYINTTYGVGSSSLDAWKFEIDQAAEKVEERWIWSVDLEPNNGTSTTTGGGNGTVRLLPSLLEEYRFRKRDFGESRVASKISYQLLAKLEGGEFLKSAAEELSYPTNMFCGESFRVFALKISFKHSDPLRSLVLGSPILKEMMDQRLFEFLGYLESKLKFFVHSSESGVFQMSSRTSVGLKFRVWPGRFEDIFLPVADGGGKSADISDVLKTVHFFFIIHGSGFSSLRSEEESTAIMSAVNTILQQAVEEFTAAVELGLSSSGGSDAPLLGGVSSSSPLSLSDSVRMYEHLFSLMSVSCTQCSKETLLTQCQPNCSPSSVPGSGSADVAIDPVSRQKRGRE